MSWSSITKKNLSNNKNKSSVQKNENNTVPISNNSRNIKQISHISSKKNINLEKNIKEYTPEEIFDFWYIHDTIDLLLDMENYTKENAFRILNNRNINLSHNFINIIKNNIELENTDKYINYIKKHEDIADNDTDEDFLYNAI